MQKGQEAASQREGPAGVLQVFFPEPPLPSQSARGHLSTATDDQRSLTTGYG